jgi:hypothetical protein
MKEISKGVNSKKALDKKIDIEIDRILAARETVVHTLIEALENQRARGKNYLPFKFIKILPGMVGDNKGFKSYETRLLKDALNALDLKFDIFSLSPRIQACFWYLIFTYMEQNSSEIVVDSAVRADISKRYTLLNKNPDPKVVPRSVQQIFWALEKNGLLIRKKKEKYITTYVSPFIATALGSYDIYFTDLISRTLEIRTDAQIENLRRYKRDAWKILSSKDISSSMGEIIADEITELAEENMKEITEGKTEFLAYVRRDSNKKLKVTKVVRSITEIKEEVITEEEEQTEHMFGDYLKKVEEDSIEVKKDKDIAEESILDPLNPRKVDKKHIDIFKEKYKVTLTKIEDSVQKRAFALFLREIESIKGYSLIQKLLESDIDYDTKKFAIRSLKSSEGIGPSFANQIVEAIIDAKKQNMLAMGQNDLVDGDLIESY